MKKLSFILISLIFIGAGCVKDEPPAKIASPQIGYDSAPITIVEFFDYQCGACKLAEERITQFLIKDYVENGDVRIIYKNMAFMGEASRQAANAALCAHEQGKFKEFHGKIFEAQGEEANSKYDKDLFKKLGREAGLDMAQFSLCVDGDKYKSQVADELEEARKRNVKSTPTFFINGEDPIIGVGTYLSFERVIKRLLAQYE